jgi:FliI/YscN family ATPase
MSGWRERAVSRWASAEVDGRLVAVGAGVLRARVPNACVGACYTVEREGLPLVCEAVGFVDEEVVLLPFDGPDGARPGATVRPTALGVRAPEARRCLGRVIDPLGQALDGAREALGTEGPLLRNAPPRPLDRRRIAEVLPTGIRVIDGFTPMGEGQRVGLFAGSGVGKSTLLAQVARQTPADVVIVGLIGERGREVGEFLTDALPAEARAKATVVVATSDAPPSMRVRAALTATALAEAWRDEGKHVLLLMDSVTRYARALREVALSSGEPPARRGYPASVFAALPALLERSGQGAHGAITAVYSVLVEGGDMEEPIADEIRGIVDGHWVMERRLAERGQFPALQPLASVSRVAPQILSAEALEARQKIRRALALLDRHEDAIDLGIYKAGSSDAIDDARALWPDLEAFVRQAPDARATWEETERQIASLARRLA